MTGTKVRDLPGIRAALYGSGPLLSSGNSISILPYFAFVLVLVLEMRRLMLSEFSFSSLSSIGASILYSSLSAICHLPCASRPN